MKPKNSGGDWSVVKSQVQVDDQSTLPSSYRSFVAYGGYDEPYAPANIELFEAEGDTNTHTHGIFSSMFNRFFAVI